MLIFWDSLVALTQISFFLLYFTPLRSSAAQIVNIYLDSFELGSATALLISGVIFLIVVRGLSNRKHWALLLQAFLLLPLFGAFPLGTALLFLIIYGLWKQEKSGYFS